MGAVRLYNLATFTRALAPYKCKLVFKHEAGFEVWETGWKQAFTVRPDPPQMYSEDQLTRAIVVIAESMPDGWYEENRGAFPAWFLFAVTKAIGVHTVRLHESE